MAEAPAIEDQEVADVTGTELLENEQQQLLSNDQLSTQPDVKEFQQQFDVAESEIILPGIDTQSFQQDFLGEQPPISQEIESRTTKSIGEIVENIESGDDPSEEEETLDDEGTIELPLQIMRNKTVNLITKILIFK